MEQIKSRKIRSPLRDMLLVNSLYLSEENFLGFNDNSATYINFDGEIVDIPVLNFPSDLMTNPTPIQDTEWGAILEHAAEHIYEINDNVDDEEHFEAARSLSSY